MQRRQVTKAIEFAVIAAFAAWSVATPSFAQETVTYGTDSRLSAGPSQLEQFEMWISCG